MLFFTFFDEQISIKIFIIFSLMNDLRINNDYFKIYQTSAQAGYVCQFTIK